MPYIGSTPTTQNFISGTDYFNGTGAQTAFTLTRTVNSVNDIQVVVNNVVQQPNDAYTLSGTTLTFTSAPSSGTNNVYVRYLSTTLQSITPSYGSIIPSMLNPPNTIYWDTSGNVGIGTSSPNGKTEIVSTSAGANTDTLVLTNANSSANTSTSLIFGVSTAPTIRNATIRGINKGGNAIDLAFLTSNGDVPAERMRIDSSGNVGIGTTVASTINAVNGVGNLVVGSGSGSEGITIYTGTTDTGGIAFADGTTTTDTYRGYINYAHSTDHMAFWTAATERMRITSAGRLAIGSTTTNFPLYVKLSSDSGDWFAKFENTQSSTPYGFYLQYPNAAPNGTASDFIYCADSAAARMTVRSNGGIANYSANDVNLSDEREKTNIQLAGSYLDKICAIPVKTFNYIDQNREEDDGLTLGVIAQDVQKVAPELVMESNWAAKDEPEKMRLSIYQTDLQYALMKCIQEQQAMIEELKARIETLEAK